MCGKEPMGGELAQEAIRKAMAKKQAECLAEAERMKAQRAARLNYDIACGNIFAFGRQVW